MKPENNRLISFLETYRLHHHPEKPVKQTDETFFMLEKVFLNLFQLGLFETYSFLYQNCQSLAGFKDWIISTKGKDLFDQAQAHFNLWQLPGPSAPVNVPTLNEQQFQFWEENGYLKIDKIIADGDCEAVCEMICETLGVGLQNYDSWYPDHELLQGMMLQIYQHPSIERIRNNDRVKAVFANLYHNQNILPNCEKVSYNPPVSPRYEFKGSPLHWDIDFDLGVKYYIQGLVYLNDVPEERGAFKLIPAFHHQIETHLKGYENPELAINDLREKGIDIAIPGKKGDLILWLQAIPHAASPNLSNLPRFVQYVSFTLIS